MRGMGARFDRAHPTPLKLDADRNRGAPHGGIGQGRQSVRHRDILCGIVWDKSDVLCSTRRVRLVGYLSRISEEPTSGSSDGLPYTHGRRKKVWKKVWKKQSDRQLLQRARRAPGESPSEFRASQHTEKPRRSKLFRLYRPVSLRSRGHAVSSVTVVSPYLCPLNPARVRASAEFALRCPQASRPGRISPTPESHARPFPSPVSATSRTQ